MEETPDVARRLPSLVLTGDNAVRLSCVAVEKPLQIAGSNPTGVAPDEPFPFPGCHDVHSQLRRREHPGPRSAAPVSDRGGDVENQMAVDV